ncbi:MAG: hypothetical protein Q9218_004775 [Villophora microphyllina]
MESPLFTIAIDEWGTGIWDFGFVNASRYTGPLSSVPVDDSCNMGGCWKIANVSAQFSEGIMSQVSCGMFDTGFDLILLDSVIVTRYYRDIPGANSTTAAGQYTFPCDVSLPDLTLLIDGHAAVIPGHVLNYHPYDIESNSKHHLPYAPIALSFDAKLKQ